MQLILSSPTQVVVSKLHQHETGAPIVRVQFCDPDSAEIVIVEMPGFIAESIGKTLHALGS